MKNLILIIAVVAMATINVNATNEKMILNTSNEVETITKENLVQVFDWNVVTNKSTYSGTSPSLEHAKKMMALVSSGERIVERKIESFYIVSSDVVTNNRTYFWEVQSENGYAKGFSSSEYSARKMIDLVALGDIISYKIITNNKKK